MFRDESTFSSTNDGLILVYRPRGELYSLQYMSSSERSGTLFTAGSGSPMKALECSIKDEHLDCLRRKRILKKVMQCNAASSQCSNPVPKLTRNSRLSRSSRMDVTADRLPTVST